MSLCGGLTSISNSTWPTDLLLFPQTCPSSCCSCITKWKLRPPRCSGQTIGLSLTFLFLSHRIPSSTLAHSLCSSHTGLLTIHPTPPAAVLTQGLCTGCFICLKTLPPDTRGHTPNFLCLCPNVTFSVTVPDIPFKTVTLPFPYAHLLCSSSSMLYFSPWHLPI